MSVFLNNSISALFAAQQALDTTSHNIANVNTPGYSRQRVLQSARAPQFTGGSYVGMGVSVNEIGRVYDGFLTEQLRSSASAEQSLQSFAELARRVDAIFGNEQAGIPRGMQRFFDAVEGMARDPSSVPARQAVLAEGNALVERFHLISGQIDTVGEEINSRLRTGVSRVNGLAGAIAQLNDRIASSPGGAPNDLLDQRDQLLTELSEQLDVNASIQEDGRLNVFVGNGQALVIDNQSFQLELIADPFDPTRQQIGYATAGGSLSISESLSGGAIGGVLDFRDQVLDPARAELGRIAVGLAETFNQAHATGMDLTGALGGDFFSTGGPVVQPSFNNAGAGGPTLTVADYTQLEARSYELSYSGGAWQLVDAISGAGVSATGTGTAGDPLSFGGLEVVVPAGAVDGDRFILNAVAGQASRLGVALDRVENIAAASPLGAASNAGNGGSAALGTPAVTDPANPALLDTVEVVFDSPTSYRLLDGGGALLSGPLVFAPGDTIDFNGWQVEVSGAPAAGDRFTVAANPAGVGDNSVALELAETARRGVFGATGISLEDLQSGLLTQVGVATQQAEFSLAAQTALRQQTELDIQSVSGVNLDEEAINLMRYQEAYQAAARAVGVAETLFQSILDAVR